MHGCLCEQQSSKVMMISKTQWSLPNVYIALQEIQADQEHSPEPKRGIKMLLASGFLRMGQEKGTSSH